MAWISWLNAALVLKMQIGAGEPALFGFLGFVE
jgi:hypothetical protein